MDTAGIANNSAAGRIYNLFARLAFKYFRESTVRALSEAIFLYFLRLSGHAQNFVKPAALYFHRSAVYKIFTFKIGYGCKR